MTNKYAYGTILGTVFLAFAKSKVGSHAKIKIGYKVNPITIYGFSIKLTDTSNLSNHALKTDCQGNEDVTRYIKSEHFSTLSEEDKEILMSGNQRHEYCRKNKNGKCILFSVVNQDEVKKAAEKVLKFLNDLSNENLVVERISDKHKQSYRREILKKPYSMWHEENINTICSIITKQIEKIGYFTIDLRMDFPNIILNNHPTFTDIGKKEFKDKIYKIIDDKFGQFGFSSDRNSYSLVLRDDNHINANTKKIIVIEKDGEVIPYIAPNITKQLKLRRR